MNQRKAGAILSYISMGLNAFIGFVYVPMLLMFFSKEQYGLYQLVGSMVAYLSIMDFGLANTTVRYYSRFLSQGTEHEQENLLAISLRLYSIIAVLMVVAGIVLLYILLPFYTNTLSAQEIIIAKQIYYVLLVNVVVVVIGNIFSAILQAHQRYIFFKGMHLLNITMQPLLVFIFLHFKASILVLVLVQTVCNILLFASNAYYAFVKLKVKIVLHKWDKAFVKEILFFSFFIFLNAIMDQIYWKSGQVILGAVVGTVSVAVYSVAVQLAMAYTAFSTAMSSVFLPHLSVLALKQDGMTEINNIFLKVGRLQFYIIMLVFLGFILFGRQFIYLWVGNSFEPAYIYALIFMFTLIIPLIQNIGISVLQAKNKHAFRAILFVSFAILNIIIAIPLAKLYGAMACAMVTGGCLLLGQGVILNIYYNNVIGLKIIPFFKQIIKIFIIVLIPTILFFLIINKLNFPITVMSIVCQIVIYSLLYAIVVWFFAFNKYEKNLFAQPIKRILRYVKH